jgi:voltage-gated potassium channel
MFGHVVVVGYGETGRRAALTLVELAGGTGVVVVESERSRVEIAGYDGAHVVAGDGCDLAVLRRAEVEVALCVVVAVHSDDESLLVTSAVRRLTNSAIITVVRGPRAGRLVTRFGATRAVVSDALADGATRRPVFWPDLLSPFIEAAVRDDDLVVALRPVHLTEVGLDPLRFGPRVLAVLRDGERLWCDEPEAAHLLPDDHLLELRGALPGG